MQCTEPILHRMKTPPLKIDNFAAYPEEVGRLGASLPLVYESVDACFVGRVRTAWGKPRPSPKHYQGFGVTDIVWR